MQPLKRYDADMDVASLIDTGSLWRISRETFERMIEAGVFPDEERIELLEGVLVRVSPQDDPHALTVVRVTNLLARRLGERALVAPQVPFHPSKWSRPEPDVALWSPEETVDLPQRPLLIVEVAGSSLRKDRLIKVPIYAAAGVPEYWIVNLVDGVIERHTEPVQTYSKVETLVRGDVIRLVSFPDVAIAVADLLPRPAS